MASEGGAVGLSARLAVAFVALGLVVLVVLIVPTLRGRFLEWIERLRHFLRASPGVGLGVLIIVLFVASCTPMKAHLEREALASVGRPGIEEPVAPDVFQVTIFDVVYGSIQLFTANMPPITQTEPSLSLRLLRISAPLVFVLWIAAAFSRVARSLWTRVILRSYAGHVTVCGSPDRIIELVNQARGYRGYSGGKMVAVTDAPVDVAVEKALMALSARVISVVPFATAGAFANAVSRASEVLIDFDDVETTFTFAREAIDVGARRSSSSSTSSESSTSSSGGGTSPLVVLLRRNAPAVRVRAFVPHAVSPRYLAAVGADNRFTVEPRLGSIPRAVLENSVIERATEASPVRILFITDRPEGIELAKVFRCAFRQAERGLVDVLLVGDWSGPVHFGLEVSSDWMRVRPSSGKGDTGFALQSLVEGRCIEGEQRPVVDPSAPVFVYMDTYRALNVLLEIERLWPDRGVPPLSFRYIPPHGLGGTTMTAERQMALAEQMELTAPIDVIAPKRSEVLVAAQMPHGSVMRGLERHLLLWDTEPQPSTLGPRPQHPLLAEPEEFVGRVIDDLKSLGLVATRFEDVGRLAGTLGLGPLELVRLLAKIKDPDGGDEHRSVSALERRGALLDVLARVPLWLSEGGFILQRSSDARPETRAVQDPARFSDDDLRRMAFETHLIYLETRERHYGSDVGDRRAVTDWERLELEYQESNLAQIRHLPVKLALLGLDIESVAADDGLESARRWIEVADQSIARDLEALSRIEHARWSVERFAAGYRHGAERRDRKHGGGPLTHPNLVPYDDLRPDERAFDMSVVVNIPRLVEATGHRLVPM
jgi:hypothetical protein